MSTSLGSVVAHSEKRTMFPEGSLKAQSRTL
jgi:hypothetical protein